MNVLEIVFCYLFLIGVFFIGISMFYILVIQPIATRILKKRNRIIEWKAQETEGSIKHRKTYSDFLPLYYVYYRINPNKINWLLNIFVDNSWRILDICEDNFGAFRFKSKQEFVDLVSPLKTYGDVKDFINNQGTVWFYP